MPPPPEQYPVLEILSTPDCRILFQSLNMMTFDRFEGKHARIIYLPGPELMAALERGEAGDLVIVEDAQLWQGMMKRGWIEPPPWRFEMHRDRLVAAVRDHQGPLLTPEQWLERIQTLATVDPQRGNGGPSGPRDFLPVGYVDAMAA